MELTDARPARVKPTYARKARQTLVWAAPESCWGGVAGPENANLMQLWQHIHVAWAVSREQWGCILGGARVLALCGEPRAVRRAAAWLGSFVPPPLRQETCTAAAPGHQLFWQCFLRRELPCPPARQAPPPELPAAAPGGSEFLDAAAEGGAPKKGAEEAADAATGAALLPVPTTADTTLVNKIADGFNEAPAPESGPLAPCAAALVDNIGTVLRADSEVPAFAGATLPAPALAQEEPAAARAKLRAALRRMLAAFCSARRRQQVSRCLQRAAATQRRAALRRFWAAAAAACTAARAATAAQEQGADAAHHLGASVGAAAGDQPLSRPARRALRRHAIRISAPGGGGSAAADAQGSERPVQRLKRQHRDRFQRRGHPLHLRPAGAPAVPCPARPLAATGSGGQEAPAGAPSGGTAGGAGSGGGGGPSGGGGADGRADAGQGGGGSDWESASDGGSSVPGGAPTSPPGPPLRIRAAGRNHYGQCGVPETEGGTFLNPVAAAGLQPPEGQEVVKISLGSQFVLMLTARGEVLHAGNNDKGQRGRGLMDYDPHPELRAVPLPAAAVDIACGEDFCAAVLGNGAVYTWGSNCHGQLGRSGEGAVPGAVIGIAAAKRVHAGSFSIFAICGGNEVHGWGANHNGELCLGHTQGCPLPQRVAALCGRKIVQLQGGLQHYIMLEADGSASVWGCLGGRLADGSTDCIEERCCVPVRLEVGPVQCVAAGSECCGVITSAWKLLLLLWGRGFAHQPAAVALPGGGPAAALSLCGNVVFACSLEGQWAACGNGYSGLPFGKAERHGELRPLIDGGLPQDCVPLGGGSSEFSLYLEGGSAKAVWTASTRSDEQVAREEQRDVVIQAVYAAALTVAVSDEALLSYATRRYTFRFLRRGLQELRCAAVLLLQSAAVPASPTALGAASPQVDLDAEDLDDGEEGSGGAQGRQQDGTQEAQKVVEGVDFAGFSKRAHDQLKAEPDLSNSTGLQRGCLVRPTAVEYVPPTVAGLPVVAQLPVGELAELAADPAGGNVKAVVVTTEGALSRVSLPTARLRRVVAGLRVLQWARDFPAAWERVTDSRDFRREDIACVGSDHSNRRARNKQPPICCLQRTLAIVSRRMLRQLDGGAAWIQRMGAFVDTRGVAALQEGIAAAHIFSLEMLNPRNREPRKNQIYSVLNAAMRRNWDEQLKEDTESGRKLALFAPLIAHLHAFVNGMAEQVEHAIVYRGIHAIVAQGYMAGEEFVWGCFSSTAENSRSAEKFSSGVGTLFVLRERTAAPIAICSMFPSEGERVLPPSRFKVLTRMPETTLCVAETRSDVVVAEEVTEKSEALGDTEQEAVASVLLRTKALSSAAFVFKLIAGRLVEPRLEVGNAETRLFAHFEGRRKQDRVTLLCGDGGTGKTSVMLALLEHMIRKSESDQETPIFIHCPWAEGLLTEEQPVQRPHKPDATGTMVGPIIEALCSTLAIKNSAELEVLKRQRLLILLDSLDECQTSEVHTPGDLLRQVPLLARGGVSADNWPHARFVIGCRREYLDIHKLGPRELDYGPVTVCSIRPFTSEEQRQYVSKFAAQEITLLEGRLGQARDPAEPLAQMRCVPCTPAAAARVKTAAEDVKEAVQTARGVPDDKKAAAAVRCAEAELERARGAAVQQCEDGVNRVLASLSPDLLANAFVLFLACSASRELAETDLSVSPRYRIYTAWVRRDHADRIARAPELDRCMPPAHDRYDRLMDAMSVLAIGMYVRRLWQTDVGTCVRLLGGGEPGRAVLSVLPLRLDSVKRDDCRVTWRHRTVQEFAIARGLLLPGRTSAADWEAALRMPLESSPEVEAFIAEGARTLSEAETKLLAATLMSAKETDNTVLITSLACLPKQQQQQPLPGSPSMSTSAGTVAELRAENAALRIRLREQQHIAAAAQERKAGMQAGLNVVCSSTDRDTPQPPAGPDAWLGLRLLRLAEAAARERAAVAAAEREARMACGALRRAAEGAPG